MVLEVVQHLDDILVVERVKKSHLFGHYLLPNLRGREREGGREGGRKGGKVGRKGGK